MAKVTPKITEITVNYSVGRKISDNNYGSMNVSSSKSEKWDVTGMTEEEVRKFYHERYMDLHDDLGEIILLEEEEMLGKHPDWNDFRGGVEV